MLFQEEQESKDCKRHTMEKLFSSDAYKSFWKKALLGSIRGDACPIFYQYIADYIIEHLVGIHFPVGMRTQSESLTKQFDFEDVSALNGSVIRSLRDKIERSAQPQKKELLLCLALMLEESGTYERLFTYVYSLITIHTFL